MSLNLRILPCSTLGSGGGTSSEILGRCDIAAEMTEDQRGSWRALTAPFPRKAYGLRDGTEGKRFGYLGSVDNQARRTMIEANCQNARWFRAVFS